MTADEICAEFGLSKSTLKSNFKRTQERFEATHPGLTIAKIGRGASASYVVDISSTNATPHALTLLEESDKEILIAEEMLSSEAMEFISFIGICVTPTLVFRGSYREFLKYLQVAETEGNICKLRSALAAMKERDLILYAVDKTDNNYFVAGLLKQTERNLVFDIHKLRLCKRLQEEHNKQSMVPLIKTWLAVEKLSKGHNIYTYADLERETGMSARALMDCSKVLKEANVYNGNKVYVPELGVCIGSVADMNAILT